jgi:hypothetical protein
MDKDADMKLIKLVEYSYLQTASPMGLYGLSVLRVFQSNTYVT